MANDDKNTDHVVLPVHAGDGEIHHISFPASTPLPVAHKALVDAGYADIMPNAEPAGISRDWAPYMDPKVDPVSGDPRPNYGPTREGVLENSPKFKAAAKAIWDKAGRGRDSNEAGTTIDQNLDRGPIVVGDQEGHMSMVVGPEAISQLHTHPNHLKGQQAGGQPSDTDIDTAVHKLHRNVYVVSKSGLQMADGKDGKVTVVYTNPDWMDRDNK